jgi:hypothetical protein
MLNVSVLRGCWGEDSNRAQTGVAPAKDGNALCYRHAPALLPEGSFPLRSTNPNNSLANYETYDRKYHGRYHRA